MTRLRLLVDLAAPDQGALDRGLRAALKLLLRCYGVRCTALRPVADPAPGDISCPTSGTP